MKTTEIIPTEKKSHPNDDEINSCTKPLRVTQTAAWHWAWQAVQPDALPQTRVCALASWWLPSGQIAAIPSLPPSLGENIVTFHYVKSMHTEKHPTDRPAAVKRNETEARL